MRTLSFFFLYAFFVEMTFAQSGWFWQNPLPQGNWLYAVCFTDANTGTAVGHWGTILRTTNGGASWTAQSSGTTSWLLGVFFTDANTGTAVGWYGTILRTTNGGASWTAQSSGTPNWLYAVSFTDANTGTAVGAGGTILRTTTGGVSSVQDDRQSEIPRDFTLFQNYPNPFNPTTTICFSLPQNSHVTLKVYDSLGREIATLVDGELNEGEHSVVFDAEGLPSGVYFYRLQAGKFVQQKKMVVVK